MTFSKTGSPATFTQNPSVKPPASIPSARWVQATISRQPKTLQYSLKLLALKSAPQCIRRQVSRYRPSDLAARSEGQGRPCRRLTFLLSPRLGVAAAWLRRIEVLHNLTFSSLCDYCLPTTEWCRISHIISSPMKWCGIFHITSISSHEGTWY